MSTALTIAALEQMRDGLRSTIDAIESVLAVRPVQRKGGDLMDHGATAMADLPLLFARMTREQLDRQWVGLVIDAVATGNWSVQSLSWALVAVRDWPDASIAGTPEEEPEPTDAERLEEHVRAEDIDTPRSREPAIGPAERRRLMLARLRELIAPTGEVDPKHVHLKQSSNEEALREVLRLHNHEFQYIPGRGTTPGVIRVRTTP